MKKLNDLIATKVILILGIMMLATSLFSQNETRYTLYNFNKMSINPAFAGNNEVLTISSHYRDQWTGLEGAPKTFTLSAHAPFFGHKVGGGFSIVADKIGIVNVYNSELAYAYRFKTGEDQTLSIGLSAQVQYSRTDWNATNPLHEGDVAISETMQAKLNPNFGVGIYYQTPKYYIGGSIPRLFRTTAYDDLKIDYKGIGNFRSYYFMAGIVHRINASVNFQPGILMSYVPNAPFEMDIQANVAFYDKLMVGVSYQLQNSINALVQFKVSRQMKIAAALDLTISDLNQYAPASFEVMMEYRLIKAAERSRNIRYFF